MERSTAPGPSSRAAGLGAPWCSGTCSNWGEINDSQRAAWQKSIGVFDEAQGQARQCALFPEDRAPATGDASTVQVRLNQLRLSRPRTWGACWLGEQLPWCDLQLDTSDCLSTGCIAGVWRV